MLDCCTGAVGWAALAGSLAFILWLVVVLRSDADMATTLWTKIGKQPESLARKVVWITGASSGIGEHIAYELARAGCRLVLSDRRTEELHQVKEACLKKGRLTEDDILALTHDVTHHHTHKAAVDTVIDKFGQIDVLVNNAGKGQRCAFMEVDLAVDRELFEVNVLGPVALTQAVLPHMIGRRQGQIAVTASCVGFMGAPLSRSYTGSKHAVIGFFRCLQTEMYEHNIGVTIVCPGPTFSNGLLCAAMGKPGERVNRVMDKDEKRMSTERCAYLYCVAIANGVAESWVALNPVLLVMYIARYTPRLVNWLFATVGVARLMKVREGK